jgi:hypothetical protein
LGKLRPRQLDAISDLRALGAATTDYLTAMLEAGASADQVRGQASVFRGELERQLQAAGLSEAAIRSYTEAALLAPSQIETAIKLSGAEQARFKLNAYLGLLQGKIPPEVATSVIAQIEGGNLDAAASELKRFAETNPVDIDLTPKGVDKLDEAAGKITDLPRKYNPLKAVTGEYTEANLDALDSVLSLGDAYQEMLTTLAGTAEQEQVLAWAEEMREEFAKTVQGLNLTETELEAYYELLGIAPEQVATAVKISIKDSELFALTTTIDLLTTLDELSPEVTLQLSDALLREDYEEVRRILEQTVTAELAANGQAALETFFAFEQYVEGSDPTANIQGNTDPAMLKALELSAKISMLNPTMEVDVVANFAQLAAAFPMFGIGFGPAGSAPNSRGPQSPRPGQQVQVDRFGIPLYGRAKGGPIGPGRDYLVGEEGPEIVRFGTIGSVLPAGPTAALMQQPASMTDDKGQQALLDGLRMIAERMAASGDTINVYETSGARQTAEEIIRTRDANRFLSGMSL